MAQSATTKSDVMEREYTVGVQMLMGAGAVLILALVFFWSASLVANSYRSNATSTQFVVVRPLLIVTGVLATLAAVTLAAMGGTRMNKAKVAPTVTVRCPYCDYGMEFPGNPTLEWDCEGCHRRVYYEHGKMAEVKQITCTFCKTVHKVAAKATTYMCDNCNRALRLADPNDPNQVVAEASSDVMKNYDVLLTEIGRNRNEVAMSLEGLLICNLLEARRQMETLPLKVAGNVPERKADAIRRRLRDLGATAVIQPTAQK
jgi:ribosomal protein L7/L12